jgi:hypothetical protein
VKKKPKTPKRFKVGARVKWTSQSAGFRTTKHGVVVSVVARGEDPYFSPFLILQWTGPNRLGNGVTVRNHESYFVVVGKTKQFAGILYWPRVNGLRKDQA